MVLERAFVLQTLVINWRAHATAAPSLGKGCA